MTKWDESVAHSILARPYTFALTNPVLLFFACIQAADHPKFRFSSHGPSSQCFRSGWPDSSEIRNLCVLILLTSYALAQLFVYNGTLTEATTI
jgi:hypothetical protein